MHNRGEIVELRLLAYSQPRDDVHNLNNLLSRLEMARIDYERLNEGGYVNIYAKVKYEKLHLLLELLKDFYKIKKKRRK